METVRGGEKFLSSGPDGGQNQPQIAIAGLVLVPP